MIVKVFGYLILISIDFKVHLTPNFFFSGEGETLKHTQIKFVNFLSF